MGPEPPPGAQFLDFAIHGRREALEHVKETHELTLFSDNDYRAAFEHAGVTVEVVPSPYRDRDRYVGVRDA